jgi:tRNA (guanine37-N1)-methyltransferase
MEIEILTLFPEMFPGPLGHSMVQKAVDNGLLTIKTHDLRDYTTDKHRVTDDYPFGGGGGMVLKPEPLYAAIKDISSGSPPAEVILMTPIGRKFDQATARELVEIDRILIVCGHYEGIDERVREDCIDREISVGDYVLSGGELPAMLVVEAVMRCIPGALGDPMGMENDSFASGILDYPHYTRPAEFQGRSVPEVLLSGHHENIDRWRRKEALRRTLERRPDLLENVWLTDEDEKMLEEIRREAGQEDDR